MCSRQLWFKSVSLKIIIDWITTSNRKEISPILISLQNLKPCSFFTQMIIWCVSNNILGDQNTYLIESWYSRPSKTYRDLASILAPLWKFLFLYYFNQGNVYAHKIWGCSQHIQWKFKQMSLLGIFLDVTLFLNMIRRGDAS